MDATTYAVGCVATKMRGPETDSQLRASRVQNGFPCQPPRFGNEGQAPPSKIHPVKVPPTLGMLLVMPREPLLNLDATFM